MNIKKLLPLAAALIMALTLVTVLPGCGGDEEKQSEKQVEKAAPVQSAESNKEETLQELKKKEDALVAQLEAGDISEEEFADKLSTISVSKKSLTREDRDKHREEERRKMREQYEGERKRQEEQAKRSQAQDGE